MSPPCRPITASPRRAVSLIEVIACTAIVAVMIVPVAGVIRASGRAISDASTTDASTQGRNSIRWIRDAIHRGNVVGTGSRKLTIMLADGTKIELFRVAKQLIVSDGRNQSVVLDHVRAFESKQIYQPESPGLPIGIEIRLESEDPKSGQSFAFQSTVATPPQP